MLFTKPCCNVLKHCLEFGDERAFHRVGGDTGPLVLRTLSSRFNSRRGQEKQFHDQPVIFCPFCGAHLQTAEAVERYLRGEPG